MWNVIKKVLSTVWAVVDFVRRAFANLVFFGLIIAVVVLLGYRSVPDVEPGSTLVINMTGSLVERSGLGSREAAFAQMLQGREPETRLRDVLTALEKAARDEAIDGVYLKLEDLDRAGLASVRELGAAMDRFRASGKRITVWAGSFSQTQYAIAAHASEIYLHSMGEVRLTGLGASRLYWGEALKRLGVTVHVFKAGAYKTFPEPYVLKGPSEQSKQADAFWMKDAWAQLTESVESARGLLPGTLQKSIDGLPRLVQAAQGDMATLALNSNLIDGVRSADQVQDLLLERQGAKKAAASLRQIGYLDYLLAREAEEASGRGIGLITLEGEIREGAGDISHIGSRTSIAQIQQARKDPSVAALVVRIDSPGGSAVASEMIRRELELVKKSGKPVVVSMGDLAASGGYWIALAGTQIVADPMSITGSIGVFGMMPTFENALEQLSIGTGGTSTAWRATAENPSLAMDPRMESVMEQTVGRTYRDFIALVAKSRSLDRKKVAELAQGRVYTGRQAFDRGLADRLGGLVDAQNQARRLAGLPAQAPVYWFEDQPETVLGWVEKLIVRISAKFNPLAGLPAAMNPTERVQTLMGLARRPGEPLAHCLCSPE